MKNLQPIKSLFFCFIIIICFTSCSKDEVKQDEQLATISVKLKSTAGELDKVFIEIDDIQLRVKANPNAPNAWVNLNAINQGTYNTYDLKEDSGLLLVNNRDIQSTYIYDIRLVLGANNFIDNNGMLMNLDVSNASNSKTSDFAITELKSNQRYDLVIDLDIDESVSFDEDNNMMVFNPTLNTEIQQIQY